jgi:hypothetical protein
MHALLLVPSHGARSKEDDTHWIEQQPFCRLLVGKSNDGSTNDEEMSKTVGRETKGVK